MSKDYFDGLQQLLRVPVKVPIPAFHSCFPRIVLAHNFAMLRMYKKFIMDERDIVCNKVTNFSILVLDLHTV